jgi:hypothetical protein
MPNYWGEFAEPAADCRHVVRRKKGTSLPGQRAVPRVRKITLPRLKPGVFGPPALALWGKRDGSTSCCTALCEWGSSRSGFLIEQPESTGAQGAAVVIQSSKGALRSSGTGPSGAGAQSVRIARPSCHRRFVGPASYALSALAVVAPHLATPTQFVGVRCGICSACRKTWRRLAHA